MDANTEFEIKAEAFRIMTGYMAPGKDAPMYAYAGREDEEERHRQWGAWCMTYSGIIRAMLRAVEHVRPSPSPTAGGE